MRREIEPLFYNTVSGTFVSANVDINFILQTESARAAMDLFRSHSLAWETVLATNGWPSVILPAYWNCYFT